MTIDPTPFYEDVSAGKASSSNPFDDKEPNPLTLDPSDPLASARSFIECNYACRSKSTPCSVRGTATTRR